MSRQVEQAENRASIRCPARDSTNMHWKVVDDLIAKHNELVMSIRTKTEELFNNETNSKEPDDDNEVDEFLKQSSPVKISKKRVIEEVDDDDDEDVDKCIAKSFNNKKIEEDDEIEIEKVEKSKEVNENDDDGKEVKKELTSASKQKLRNKTSSKDKVSTMSKRKSRCRTKK